MLPVTRRLFLSALAPAFAQSPRPNVILILADDLGFMDLAYRGGPMRTPHLDRMAGMGLQLEQFYTYPLCSPTRSALMTGRNPVRFGLAYSVVHPWDYYGVPTSEVLLPERFRQAGYQTGVIGKWHLGHANKKLLPNSRGFDHFYGHVNGAIDYFTHERDGGLDWQRNGTSLREPGYTSDLFGAEAARWIEARDRQRPFFLYLAFNSPHSPLQAPKSLIDGYEQITDSRRRTYAAMVEAMDRAVGQLLSTLERERQLENTILFFCSDNGGFRPGGADNGPLRAGKATPYEGGIRVPALLYAPGRIGPGRSGQQMAAWDVLPTLAAAAGVPLGDGPTRDGQNLWPVLSGSAPERPRGELFFAVQAETGPKQYALRDGDWKLVRILSGPASEQIYNIAADPFEKTDLAASEPARLARMAQAMDRWIALHPKGDVTVTASPHPGWTTPKDWSKVAVE
jgi:arylsulfatase A-like enzyme